MVFNSMVTACECAMGSAVDLLDEPMCALYLLLPVEVADRIILMIDGSIAEDGSAEEALDTAGRERTRQFLANVSR